MKLSKVFEVANVVELLDKDEVMKIGAKVVRGFETDFDSNYEWMAKAEQWVELAAQVMRQKTYPWPNASNVKYPLLTTAAVNFSARAYPAIVNTPDVVKCRTYGNDVDGLKQDRAERISQHMTYQLLEEMSDWEEGQDRLLTTLPIMGTVFKKTYFDPVSGVNRSDLVLPRHLVVNYFTKTLERSPRVTHVFTMDKNDVKVRVNMGLFSDEDLSSPSDYKGAVDDRVYQTYYAFTDKEELPHLLLEQHTYLDLDDDGYDEPYIVTVDYQSHKVLRIVPRFEYEDIQFSGNMVVQVEPTSYFTKYSFIPNPDGGFYDVGFGLLLGGINGTIDTLINQLIDAGTQSNLQSGFLSRGIRLKGGSWQFKPGEWKVVNSTGDDLSKGIVPLPVREPSGVLLNLLQMLIQAGNTLAQTTDMQLGDAPGQNTANSTYQTALEQGLKVYSGILKRVHRSFKEELRKLYKLNQKYLGEEQYFQVIDPDAEEQKVIGQSDYLQGDACDIIPASDPTVTSDSQRIQQSQVVMGLLQTGLVNPQAAVKNVLKANKISNIAQLMQVPQQGPDIKQQELDFKKQQWADEVRLREMELGVQTAKNESDTLKKRAAAIKDIATAESLEVGNNVGQYSNDLENIVRMDQLTREQVTHAVQMRRDEEQHQADLQQKQLQMTQMQQAQQPNQQGM